MISPTDCFRTPAPGGRRRIAILGAGPVGLDAALAARERGFEVRAWESAPHPAGHVRRWGHVRLFTPWRMNLSDRMRRGLRELPGDRPWDTAPDSSPTGHEYARLALDPLWGGLDGVLRTGVTVRAVSRQGVLKHEEIGAPERARRPFRILLSDAGGREWTEFADVVLDCTGKFGNPNTLGDGGIPAPGERGLEGRIARGIPDLESEGTEWAGAAVLLVGGGHSAQTAVDALERLAREHAGTRIEWALRGGSGAMEPIEDDPLPRRHTLTTRAAELADGSSPDVLAHRGTVVDGLEPAGARIRVRLREPDGGMRTLEVDRILGLTGGVGDHGLYRQLQVHECYATSGPMKLAASLLGSGGDCLVQPEMGFETLANPEPDFFLVGDKSYGRNNTFLLEVGWSQVDEIFGAIGPSGS